MRIDTFSSDTGASYDRELWNELCSLRFLDDARGALLLGPVGVGKTHLATALGHVAIRRRRSVHFTRADQLFRTLKAARLDNSVEAEMRRLTRVELLIIDDFALKAMDQIETADFYELIVERHQQDGHDRHLEPRRQRVDRADERPAARPVRHRPARGHQLRTRHRRRVLPPPTTTPTRRHQRRVGLTTRSEPMNIIMLLWWSLASWQPGGPITLASDIVVDRGHARGRGWTSGKGASSMIASSSSVAVQ